MYKQQLDSLRFVAFITVFFHHSHLGEELEATGLIKGDEGVNLFFVLSGFLITRILVNGETGSIRKDLSTFYLRRALRIFPLYYLSLSVLLICGQLNYPLWHFTYLSNVNQFRLESNGGLNTAHFWTLCIEEQFYLFFPLLLLSTPQKWRSSLLVLLLAVCCGSRFVFEWWRPGIYNWARGLLPVSGEVLLWGCLAGYIERRTQPHQGYPTGLFWGGCYCIFVVPYFQFTPRTSPGSRGANGTASLCTGSVLP
jgi:peptidoglycan/LPS O-acetylase OafA/YrhL